MPSYPGSSASSRPGEVAGTLKLLAYVVAAFVLIVLDHRDSWLAQLRGELNIAAQPVWWAAGLPGKLGMRLHDDAGTLVQLTRENRELRNQLLVANTNLARLGTVATENAQLRGMLGSAQQYGLDVQLAPVLNIDLDPSRQRLILAVGSRDGAHVGQGVVDAGGLIGQIVQTTPMSSTVLMITDPDHAVPAMVGRNGVRLVVYGTGRADALELVNVPTNSDVKVGDLIVTSGMGGRFPAGFPIGTVTELHHDDSHTFLVGVLKPAAQLDRGRDVLLLKSDQAHPPPKPDAAATATATATAPAAASVVPAAITLRAGTAATVAGKSAAHADVTAAKAATAKAVAKKPLVAKPEIAAPKPKPDTTADPADQPAESESTP